MYPFPRFILCVMFTLGSAGIVFAAPPVPFLDDNEPGVNLPFAGDPDTTEDGCSQLAERAVVPKGLRLPALT